MITAKIKRYLLSLSMLWTGVSAFAYDFGAEGLYYNILSEENRTVEVTYKNRKGSTINYDNDLTGNVEIPTSVISSGKAYSVTAIGVYAFSNCSGLTSVTIPNTVTTIGASAFRGCSGLTAVVLPESVTSISESAFYSCSGLTAMTIPNSVTAIGESAFSHCGGLTTVTISNSVTTISNLAFSYCSGLTTVTIPNSVTVIGESAFNSCSGLTSVVIPNSVATIGSSAFSYCSGLTTVTIPNSVTTIGERAFFFCVGLTVIYCQCATPPTASASTFTETLLLKGGRLYVPVGSRAAYEAVDPWRNFSNIEEHDFTGADETIMDNGGLQISVDNGTLTINGADSNELSTIYDMQGRVVYRGTERIISDLASGLYIVSISNKAVKVKIQ